MATSSARAYGAPVIDAWSCAAEPVTAVCYFGVMRNPLPGLPAANRHNVLRPLGRFGGVDLFIHTLLLPRESEQREAERSVRMSRMAVSPRHLFDFGSPCRLAAEDQDEVDQRLHAQAARILAGGGSYYRRSNVTLRNIVRGAYSLHRSASLAKAREARTGRRYQHVVALRLDTAMLTPVQLPEWAFRAAGTVILPNFHHWGGLNDRFACGSRDAMFEFYMNRLNLGLDTIGLSGSNTESFVCHVLMLGQVRVAVADWCVVRVRADGRCHLPDVQDGNDYAVLHRTACQGIKIAYAPPRPRVPAASRTSAGPTDMQKTDPLVSALNSDGYNEPRRNMGPDFLAPRCALAWGTNGTAADVDPRTVCTNFPSPRTASFISKD